MKNKFTCVHLGARSHYLIPRAMELRGNLGVLITDTWVTSPLLRALLVKIPLRSIKSLSNRYSNQVVNKHVNSFSFKSLFFEIYLRLIYKNEWRRILFRNKNFQNVAVNSIKNLPTSHTVFATSYTALKVFRIAKERAQRTVLFQIDPGREEENIVSHVVSLYKRDFPTRWEAAPSTYWNEWKEECELADCIMVNSEWSKNNLIKDGVSPSKIRVIALPFKIEAKHLSFNKNVPEKFNRNRPMRCLFLGTLTLRKGVHHLLQAAERLTDFPVEFILVGQNELKEISLQLPNVIYRGVATRAETDYHYKEADIFLFPTLSDGFGLTQLEAMAWQLPVIASTNCGKVVAHLFNGYLMSRCSTEALIEAILYFLQNPSVIKLMSDNCIPTVQQFNIEKFSKELSDML
jgi:glycosyltransferase involved in cell wall biosynthesis